MTLVYELNPKILTMYLNFEGEDFQHLDHQRQTDRDRRDRRHNHVAPLVVIVTESHKKCTRMRAIQTHAVVIWSEHVAVRTHTSVVADSIDALSNAADRCIELAFVRV